MTLRYTSLLMVCVCLSTFGQTILTPEDYNSLKGHDQLPSGPIVISGNPGTGAPVSSAVLERGGGACDCWIAPDNSYSQAMLPNDDMSSSLLILPFTFDLLGQNYTELYINNNGNVSFANPYGTYTASGFPSIDFIMVAPFWADVDTRGEDGNGLNGGEVVYKITDHALYVNWVDVGYFASMTDKHNSFQLIITDGTDPVIPAGNNVSFCYQDMQWTTGSASSGVDGFGGVPATVGVNKGNGIDHAQVGRFSLNDSTYAGPYVESSGISWLDDTHFYLSTMGTGVPPIFGSTFACDTVIVQISQGSEDRDGELYHLIVLPGAPDELVSCISQAPTLPNFVNISEGPSEKLELEFQINSDEAAIGVHYITFTAQNNDLEPLSSTYVLQVEKTGASTSGVGPEGTEVMIQMAPNPAFDETLLTWPAVSQVSLIEVIAADGRTLISERPTGFDRSLMLDLKASPEGMYVVRTTTTKGIFSKPLVKLAR